MERDFYKVLGVSADAGPAEIRATYRALMRIYHPDADRSEEAAQRSRELNAAYSVLSNPEKRAEYDSSLNENRRIRFEPAAAVAERRRSYFAPVAAIGISTLAAGMIALAMFPSMPGLSATDSITLEQTKRDSQPLAAGQPEVKATAVEELCDHSLAPGLMKRELFLRAAENVTGNPILLVQSEPMVSARLESPHGDGKGKCGGWLSLEIPPGLEVEGGRSSLTAKLAYSLSRNDEGVLRLSGLSGAGAIIRSLTMLAREPRTEPAKPAPAVPERISEKRDTGRQTPTTPADPSLERASGDPCSSIVNRSEKLLCQNGNLAALDRQLASFYRQSWDRADERKRALLAGTRQSFNDRRDACDSSGCMTTAYVARLREIGDIMAGRTVP